MRRQKQLRGIERERLLEDLYRRYSSKRISKQRIIYFWKKYSWILVVSSAKFAKRTLDLVFSLILLILLFPLFLLIGLLIKLTDGGSIFYVSTRIGQWGEEFRFPKFRSMVIDAEQQRETLTKKQAHLGKRFKMKEDPRVTWIGRIIRKASIDELPQLWCVLKGKMSLVGPRPPLPSEVNEYTLEERRRLEITPGLTCIWQVSGRSDISFDEQVQLDMRYIESQNLLLDLFLLLKTIPTILLGRGAY